MRILDIFRRRPSRADKNLINMYRAAMESTNPRYVSRVIALVVNQWGDGRRYWKLKKHLWELKGSD